MLTALRHAWRSLVRAPLVSVGIVLCVGLGVGSTTAVFAWMEHLVWRPLPAVEAIDRLVSLTTRGPEPDGRISYPDYLDVRDAATSVRGLAAFGIRQFGVRPSLNPSDAPHSAWGLLVTDDYFDVLGVRAMAGRTFVAGESQAGARIAHAVVSAPMAKAQFGSVAAAIGHDIRINDVPFTIIGVAPADFSGTIAGLAFDLWLPVTMHPLITGEDGTLARRDSRWLQAFGRLRAGVGRAEAEAEFEAIGGHLARIHPEHAERGVSVTRFDTGVARRLETLFGILVSMAGLLTLIVCTNVANLLLLQGAVRRYEIGVCLALGASRRHIFAQFLIEAALLAAGGAVTGLVLARWAGGLLPALMPASPLPLALDAAFDWRIFAFALALSVAMLTAFGLGPAIQAVRRAVLPNLRLGRSGTTRNAARLRAALVAAQLALSVAALASAAVFLRAGGALSSIDRGLSRPEEVLVVATDFEQAGYHATGARLEAAERLLAHVRALPNVRAAALATFVPLGFGGYSATPTRIPGYTPDPGENMMILANRVSPDYFQTVGVPIRRGRAIDGRDTSNATAVVVVNEAFVQRFLAGRAVIGSRIECSGREVTVIGIAANGKYRFDALDDPSPPHVYFAYAQQARGSVTLHVRASGPPGRLLPDVRRAFADVNPALPMNSPTTLDAYTSVPLLPIRLGTVVLSSLGAAALILASAGLYSVVAYRMTQRWRELALRTALGASPLRLLQLTVGQGLRQVVAGLGVGLLLGLIAVRIIGSRVPRAAAQDPVALAAAAGLLLVVAMVAVLVPAIRVRRIDPARVLRTD